MPFAGGCEPGGGGDGGGRPVLGVDAGDHGVHGLPAEPVDESPGRFDGDAPSPPRHPHHPGDLGDGSLAGGADRRLDGTRQAGLVTEPDHPVQPGVLLGTLYLIYRDRAITGGCGSRYGVACSGKQSAHIFAALVVMPASMACVMFLNRVVLRPYRRGHETYRLIGPLLLAAGAVELFATDAPLGGAAALLGAVGPLPAFRKPVGVRGMVWGLSQDRLRALTTDPEAEPLSTARTYSS